jgi:hypothetical protein
MSKSSVKSIGASPGFRPGPALAGLGLAALLAFQVLAFGFRLPLLLAPRTVLHPWLLNLGFVEYEHIVDQHSPLMPQILAWIAPLAPDAFATARAALTVLVLLTTVLTFLAARKWAGNGWALWAAFMFTVCAPKFGFQKLWYETFLAPLYLSWFFFHDAGKPARSAGAALGLGALGGIAILIKQQAAIVFLLFLVFDATIRKRAGQPVSRYVIERGMPAKNAVLTAKSAASAAKNAVLTVSGAVLTIAAYAVFHCIKGGTLGGIWKWTVVYNLTSPYHQWASLRPTVAQLGTVSLCFLLLPAAFLDVLSGRKDGNRERSALGLALLLAAAGCLTAYPLFELYHLQPALAMAAIASGLALKRAVQTEGPARSFVSALAVALPVTWTAVVGFPIYRQVLHGADSTLSQNRALDRQERGLGRPERGPDRSERGLSRQERGPDRSERGLGRQERGPDRPERGLDSSTLDALAQKVRAVTGPGGRFFLHRGMEDTANLYYLLQSPPPKYWVIQYPWYFVGGVEQKLIAALIAEEPEWVLSFPDRWDTDRLAPALNQAVQSRYATQVRIPWRNGEVLLMRRRLDPETTPPVPR